MEKLFLSFNPTSMSYFISIIFSVFILNALNPTSLIFSQFPLFFFYDGPDVSPLCPGILLQFSINIQQGRLLVAGHHRTNVFHHYVNAHRHLDRGTCEHLCTHTNTEGKKKR